MLLNFANPKRFEKFSKITLLFTSIIAVLLIGVGLYLALVASPPDYQMKESVRIMYIHVPAAWLSLLIYASLGAAALSHLIWRHTLAGLYIRAAAPVGAAFTATCLISGALWGQPSWGTWWVWDARLTSMLVLFFLYLGLIGLIGAFDNPEKGEKAASWLALTGLVNLPIIKFSVEWWNTLHQPASLTSLSRLGDPAIHSTMLMPLLVMAGGFMALYIALSLLRLNNEIMGRRLHVSRLRELHG